MGQPSMMHGQGQGLMSPMSMPPISNKRSFDGGEMSNFKRPRTNDGLLPPVHVAATVQIESQVVQKNIQEHKVGQQTELLWVTEMPQLSF